MRKTATGTRKAKIFNTKHKIFSFYGVTFLILFIGSIIWTVCIAKLDPDITVSYLFHKKEKIFPI